MGAFEYVAVDTAGKERKGVLEGDTARQVRQSLRDQNLLPVSVNEVAQRESRHSKQTISLRRGVSAADLSLLTRQLSTLVRSGLPLEEALQAVSEQTEKPRIQTIMMGVRATSHGRSFARRRVCRLSSRLSRAVPRDRRGRRAVGPSGYRARAPGGLHRKPRATA